MDKLMKDFEVFLQKEYPDGIPCEETAENAFSKFIQSHKIQNLPPCESDSDDYLELSMCTNNKKKKLEYLDKALAADPDNLDAKIQKAVVTAAAPEEILTNIEHLAKQEERQLKKDGFFGPNYAGEFWGFLETRPYMRLLAFRTSTLISCGMWGQAVQQCEQLLDLCENDNLGMRFYLMHLYAALEQEEKAKKLLARYKEDVSCQMLLPMSVLYYKLGNYKKAQDYLDKVAKYNKDLKKFVNAVCSDNLEQHYSEMSPMGYHPFHMDELLTEYEENYFLFDTVPSYFLWAKEYLKGKKRSANSK